MAKHLWSIVLVLLVFACSEHRTKSCAVSCTSDLECPDGQTCGDLGLCTAGEACPCTAGAFLGCADDSTARFCSASGSGVTTEACGAPGCNADAGRCNTCVPGSLSCSADNTMLERCGDDGVWAASEACTLGCVAGTESTAPHCGHIEPMFLPNICDTPASEPALTVSADTSLDTSTDATCNGGIVTQANAPEICVIRYGTIDLAAGSMRVTGRRAIAFVADDALLVRNALDVSANGSLSGPGGGWTVSGEPGKTAIGGGGAGFRTAGAAGGLFTIDANGNGAGGAGGPQVSPLDTPPRLIGGPRATTYNPFPPGLDSYPAGGGGGGALALISCRDTVSISGIIDAGGGGGAGGRDTRTIDTNYSGAAGGGAGGYVVLQGAEVRVTGLGVWANGGGGGGGCSTDNCSGSPGQDALPSTASAQGGFPGGQGGGGGKGGTNALPTFGFAGTYSPGGGGGAAGWLQTFTPEGGRVEITSPSSPSFDGNRIVPIR